MQGLSPEHPEATEPLHTATPEGTPEDSPQPGEIPLVPLTHVDVSDVPEVFTPHEDHTDPLVDPLASFRIQNSIEDYRTRRGERPGGRFHISSDDLPPPESIAGPSHGTVGQGPSWSGDFQRVLFGPESPESPESEITPATTTYRFILPPEMAHLANTTSVQTGIPATTLAPINTQRTPAVNPTLPPGYHALNPALNVPHPTPPQTPVGSPGGPQFPGHPIPGFIPTLPQFPTGIVNPSGTIPTVAPTVQFPVGGPSSTIPFPGQTTVTTQPPIGTQFPGGSVPLMGGPHSPLGQNIPPALAQYWTQLLQNVPQIPGGQQTIPTQGQPYPGVTNPIWGSVPSTQPQVPTQTQGQNPWGYYPILPPPGQPGSSLWGQTAYAPTGLPTGLPPQSHQYPQVNRQLPFLATLDLPDLSRILNDPIRHSPQWPAIPAKLPSDIPKFDGKAGDDPNNHVMTFHLWCSSNSLMDDSIRLRLFQRTLTGAAAKWYIELPRGFFSDFNTLAMAFLTHYQLPIRYDTGTEILTSFKQDSGTHISDHIHEWRRRRRLIKLELPDQLLAEWFTKSFVNKIAKDIAMGGVVTEEQAISRAQYLDLVYSQTGTLYDLLPDLPRPGTSSTSTAPVASHAADGVIGATQAHSHSVSTTTPKSNTSNVQNAPSPAPPAGKTSEVNAVQTTPTGKNTKNRKGRGKTKEGKNANQNEQTKTPPVDDRDKRKPRYPCLMCGDDHYTKDCPRRAEVHKFLQSTSKPSTPAVLSQPFPSQQQASLVIHDQPSTSTQSYVLMCTADSKKDTVTLTTRAKDYTPSKEKVDDTPPDLVSTSPLNPSTSGPLHLERPNLDTVIRPPPKGVVKKSAFNPHARAAQNYSIVEDLAQAPSAMSALEVLQSCPAQRRALLKAIGGIDPTDENLIVFDLNEHVPRLPAQLAFQIQVIVADKSICRTVVDEGASTCVMSFPCWKAIGSPPLTESQNTLRAFNGSGFKPYGVLPSLPITLGGKTVQVEVEVFDTPLDYNLLLGRSWVDPMRAVVSTLFRVLRFPHQGKVVTIDQLSFFNTDTRTGNVPFITNTPEGYENVGVGLLKDSSLMGTFPIPPPPNIPNLSVASIHMISTVPRELPVSADPWIVPAPGDHVRFGNVMPLSPIESDYQAIQSATPPTSSYEELSPDPFRIVFPTDEMIMSVLDDTPWDDGHHRSILFLEQQTLENYQRISAPSTVVVVTTVPGPIRDVFAEGNLSNISPTMPIDISIKPGIVENVHIGTSCSPEEIITYTSLFKEFRDIFAWSYEEMPGIDPSIVVHEIKTYPGAKPVRQRLRPVHPRKAAAIKLEVEKLLKAGFIYPVALTEWVSNPVPIDKKGGSIRVCVDYRDINKACPKDNFPTPFVDQIVDDCAGSEIFSLMDGFSGYNQINIAPEDQHKTAFICPWGTFAYRKLPFGLKNAGATFQRAMSYAFHDIKHIVQPYLDDLPAHSMRRIDHPMHLRAIFVRCRFYRIRLNPHKCVFCVESGRLLGFIVSRHGIRVDPIKVEAILNIPPPSSLRQLQSLQGKANFLRRFIPNYAEITRGFTRLLKKGSEFVWDKTANDAFEALKLSLTKAPLLFPPDYSRDYFLYLAASEYTIGMVLVQEDDNRDEHVIYYLSRSLTSTEIKYQHVEKLALAAVQAVQRFRHYILARKTIVISHCNPMQHILTRQLLGGKYSKWIVILQEFDLEFDRATSKKSLVFAELICDFPHTATEKVAVDSLPDESLFLIATNDIWYGDIIIYLQTQNFRPELSSAERRRVRYQARNYIILGDTLYRRGIDSVFRRCLTFEEAERVLNDCHSGACGGHMSGYATAQKILRAGYFWPSLFKDCITAVQKCHACQTYNQKIRSHPAPLHPVVSVGPFAKWGIDFMTCHPHSAGGHGYIIVAVDYFTKWAEAMPTFDNTGKTAALFLFNHVITRFGVPQAIVTDHGSHFRNNMMSELTAKLGLRHDSSTPYYPQANGQVEAINKVLITMIRRMIGIHKNSWHTMLFSALWAYRTSVKSATGFTPFRLVYGMEAILPIECEIPSLKLAVELLPNTSAEEERLLYLMRLDETRRDATLVIEAQKKRVKAQYDKHVKPRVFSEGDLVLLYEQDKDVLGAGKFEPMWRGPYIVSKVLAKGAYELVDYDGIPLSEPRNGLYLKKYYA
jgi:hypothetical protein